MMMGFGFLSMLLLGGVLLAFVVGAAILVFRQTTDARPLGGPGQPTARQVLDERFARGEIDRQEYEAIRARIEQ